MKKKLMNSVGGTILAVFSGIFGTMVALAILSSFWRYCLGIPVFGNERLPDKQLFLLIALTVGSFPVAMFTVTTLWEVCRFSLFIKEHKGSKPLSAKARYDWTPDMGGSEYWDLIGGEIRFDCGKTYNLRFSIPLIFKIVQYCCRKINHNFKPTKVSLSAPC